MGAVAASLSTQRDVAPTVCTCYDVLDVALATGVSDLTDGKYVDERNDQAAYLAAQHRQAEYLLDQVGCGPGSRILDIGCGYGRMLEHATRRSAEAVGITISPPQVRYCRARGLEVYEQNYRDIFGDGDRNIQGPFDGLVANGSLEHFVQTDDAANGRADSIYAEMFGICHRLLRPGGRLATTAIHFRDVNQVRPADLLLGPDAHPPGSQAYHFAMIERSFGGWYPEPGQLQRCAAPHFELVDEEDGTHDYHLTSEYWLRRLKWGSAFDPRVWVALARAWWRHPRPLAQMLRCILWAQSWAWQFRSPAPTRPHLARAIVPIATALPPDTFVSPRLCRGIGGGIGAVTRLAARPPGKAGG
jgi:cyclopropane fatty-acyl-phospholipid synthase-like methyltransferase